MWRSSARSFVLEIYLLNYRVIYLVIDASLASRSIPALAAAKCASFQSKEAYDRMHYALFEAFFTRGMNIAKDEEIVAIANECQLEMARFEADFAGGEGHKLAIEEYEEAINHLGVTAVPTVFFGRARVVGAVPLQEYLQILEELGVR